MQPIPKPAKSGDVALAGKDGAALAALVQKAQDEGAYELYQIVKDAVSRLAGRGIVGAVALTHLFNGEEYKRLTELLASIVATGGALGHYRVREREQKARAAGGFHRFAEGDEVPFASVQASGDLPLLDPIAAIEYFKSLIPRLGIDPYRFGPVYQRTAMTLAAATEKTLTERVQARILDKLKTGEGFSEAPRDIESLIADVGVSPSNPQYAQMVFRTNMMDSYNVGVQLELEEPDMQEFFPVWKYLGIHDGREGDDHRPQFGKYFANSAAFDTVRGPRPFNCRCTPVPIDRYQWDELKSNGAVISPVPTWVKEAGRWMPVSI